MIIRYPEQYMPKSFVLVSGSGDMESAVRGCAEMREVAYGLSVITSELYYENEVRISERYDEREAFQLAFCLCGGCEWEWSGGARRISAGQCCVSRGLLNNCVSLFQAGRQSALSLSLDARRFAAFSEALESAGLTDVHGCSPSFEITPRMRLILRELEECPADMALRDIYIEGKALELIAVFCSEAAELKEWRRFSRDDYAALLLAKEIIDCRFTERITIAELARSCYMGETKLKRAFRECFGCTIYEYIVDKRMESAYALLESNRYRVKDVVWMVGYASASHFSENFRKKYGFLPRDMK